MGNNVAAIETRCVSADPVDTWSKQPYPHPNKQEIYNPLTADHTLKLKEDPVDRELSHHKCTITKQKGPDHVISAKPQNYLKLKDLPENFWWGNKDGVNYLSYNVDQHVPQYCGSCWAQAPLSALTDRINILQGNKWPKPALAAQVIIDCHAGGSCNGGNSGGVYQFIKKLGIPEVGCSTYQARNPAHFTCSAIQKCENCASGQCSSQFGYKKWYVKEHGTLQGVSAMKKEIFARGPISCSMCSTKNFTKYVSGIYSEKVLHLNPNHEISVVGWGKDPQSGVEYWIVRNSWGSRFGLNGYFEVEIGPDGLGIGHFSCHWAVPVIQKSDPIEQASSITE